MTRTPEDREVYIGQAFGVLAMIAGLGLSITGGAGSIEWLVESQTVTSRLINATPGILLVLIGGLVLWRYKPKQPTSPEFRSHDAEQEPGGPRSRLSVDAVRRLQEEVERARSADKDRHF